MTDYIKREDETGYIKKADAIRTAVRESAECLMDDDYTEADSSRVGEVIARVIYALQTITSADVVEVVRCKDCFLFGECKAAEWYGENGNGYCSIGDRMKDND